MQIYYFCFLAPLLVFAIDSITKCSKTQYYNTLKLLCEPCPTNTKPFNSTLCVCDLANGFSRSSDNIIGFQSPTLCQPFQLTCAKTNQVVPRYSKSGAAKEALSCIECAASAYTDPWQEECIQCPHQNMTGTLQGCTCSDSTTFVTSNGTCILRSSLVVENINWDDEYRLTFDVEITSEFIKQKFEYAIVGCYRQQTYDACQLLINICILQLYNRQYDICNLFFLMGNPATIPQLFIIAQNALRDTSFVSSLSLDSVDDRRYLPYYLAVFDVDGKYIGFKRLDSEFILCPHQPSDAKNARAFGLNMQISCTLSMQPFADDYKMQFYELFLQVDATNYARIPISVLNYRDKNGNFPNKASPTQTVTRFFIIDNVATKPNYLDPYATAQYIRYAKTIRFVITPQENSVEKIYIPYVEIEYDSIRGIDGIFGSASVSFEVHHVFNSANYWTTIIILFSIVNVFAICTCLFRIYIWTKANPRESIGQFYFWSLIRNGIRLLFDSWNDWIFLFLFLVTAHWFVFFKFQTTPFIMMLDQSENQPFFALFYTMFAIRLLLVFHLIYKQSTISIFFIDWEKTEFELPKAGLDTERQRQVSSIKNKQSIWRTLLVANEFNELQVVRTLSVEWTLLIFAFFMIGLQWQLRFSESPDLIETQNFVPTNPILRYFLIQVVYLTIGFTQLILRRVLSIWNPYPYEDFVDLCSIANVSIFILDDNLHGYYIHGENPFGFSEGSLQHLQECFKNEAKEKGKNRGLLKDSYDSTVCTFELYIPHKFKESFESGYNNLRNYKEKNELKQLGIEKMEYQKFKIDRFLKDKINEVRRQDRRSNFVRTKEMMQKFFEYPPDEISRQDFSGLNLPYFFTDKEFTYKNVLFCGHEMFFLITDLIIYSFWVIITDNLPGSILLQYFCSKALEWLKSDMQRNNISEKTGIDKRFLV